MCAAGVVESIHLMYSLPCAEPALEGSCLPAALNNKQLLTTTHPFFCSAAVLWPDQLTFIVLLYHGKINNTQIDLFSPVTASSTSISTFLSKHGSNTQNFILNWSGVPKVSKDKTHVRLLLEKMCYSRCRCTQHLEYLYFMVLCIHKTLFVSLFWPVSLFLGPKWFSSQ